MTPDPIERWSLARRFVAGTAAAFAAVVWSHGFAALSRHLGPDDAPRAGLAISLCAVLAAVAGAVALPRRGVAVAGGAGVLAGAVAALIAVPSAAAVPWAGLAAVAPAAALATAGGRWLGRQLPAAVDTALSRRRVLAAAWALVAALALFQTARLAAWVSDPSQEFVAGTRNPFWFGHECLPAYLHGAELALAGDDPYAHRHWPALDSSAQPVSRLAMRIEDPYQYPPPFLLLPAAALAASGDYLSIRAAWFALNVTLFAAVFAALAAWVGGRGGRFALWALPAALAAFPVAYDFQYGQFHLAAVGLAVAAMLAFDRGRRAGGGLLLALAVLAKLFPAVLLVVLAAQRRVRALAWTAGWGLAIGALAFAVLGPAPFVAFWEDHLPRLADGSAFAFDEAWPELASLVVIDNQGVFGLARKLGAGKPAAAAVSRLFTVALLAAALWTGRRFRDASRWGRGALWLALLGVGSLASPGAWGDYVPSTAVWLLALVAARAAGRPRLAATVAVVAVFQVFLLGTMPIGDWGPEAVLWPLSTVGAVLLLGLFAAVLGSRPDGWRGAAAPPVAAPAPGRRAA